MLKVGGDNMPPEAQTDLLIGVSGSEECFGDYSQICFVYKMGYFANFILPRIPIWRPKMIATYFRVFNLDVKDLQTLLVGSGNNFDSLDKVFCFYTTLSSISSLVMLFSLYFYYSLLSVCVSYNLCCNV